VTDPAARRSRRRERRQERRGRKRQVIVCIVLQYAVRFFRLSPPPPRARFRRRFLWPLQCAGPPEHWERRTSRPSRVEPISTAMFRAFWTAADIARQGRAAASGGTMTASPRELPRALATSRSVQTEARARANGSGHPMSTRVRNRTRQTTDTDMEHMMMAFILQKKHAKALKTACKVEFAFSRPEFSRLMLNRGLHFEGRLLRTIYRKNTIATLRIKSCAQMMRQKK
jgi:hypothetical protein